MLPLFKVGDLVTRLADVLVEGHDDPAQQVLDQLGLVRRHLEALLDLEDWVDEDLGRVANDSQPGRLIDSKIMVELKILFIILVCHNHAVVVE